MGEHATYAGQSVKIGTCEDMYYLRADQRDEIEGYDFSQPVLDVIRFRFPFPDEDGTEPGRYDDYSRGVRIPGWSLPAELSGDEHHSIQFKNDAGYLLSIPCPEQYGQPGMKVELPNGLTVHRNGWNGGPVVRQQAFRGGHLVTIVSCGACGALHRLDTLEDARPVIDAFYAEAERQEWTRNGYVPAHSLQSRLNLQTIAERIEAGYAAELAEVVVSS